MRPDAGMSQGMSRAHKLFNLAGSCSRSSRSSSRSSCSGTRWVDWSDLAVLAIMYVLTGYGVTLGFHRLLTHRSFQTHKPVEYTLAGSARWRSRAVMTWVADHRKHHAHTDKDGDPHSPHGHGGGVKRRARRASGTRTWAGCSTAPARRRPSATRRTSTRTAGCAHPPQLPSVRARRVRAAVRPRLADRRHARWTASPAALWGGAVRIFLLHHVTWSINSVCHFFGRRRFASTTTRPTCSGSRCSPSASRGTTTTTRSRARRVHGLRWWELDPTGWLVRAMKRLRLAWNVVEILPERQRQTWR